MTIKILHQIAYYIVLFPLCLALIIRGLTTKCVGEFDRFYLKINDIMNKIKGEYEEIGR